MRRLLSIKEAANYLGVCQNTFEKWLDRGLIHGYKLDGLKRIFYDIRELDQFFESAFDRVEAEKSVVEEISARRR